MLALLPLAALAALTLAFRAEPDAGRRQAPDLRDALARGLVAWAVSVAAISETLGAFHRLSTGWLAAGWAFVILVAALVAARRAGFPHRAVVPRPTTTVVPARGTSLLLIALLVLVLGSTLVVAVASPPQEGDALAYHMSRIAHWSQNSSLGVYATADGRQIWSPPWAELAALNLSLLSGSDRWVNLVGWGCLALTAVLATRVASLAGAGRPAQLIAGLFVATLPIAVPQATSLLTDLPAGLWVIVTAWVVVRARVVPARLTTAIWLGLAAGLGVLTKGSYLPYGGILAAWHLGPGLRRDGLRASFLQVVVMGCLSVMLVVSPAVRNWRAFGSPFGLPQEIAGLRNQQPGIQALVSNAARSGSLLLTAPVRAWNEFIEKGVFWLHRRLLRIDPSDPAFTLPGGAYGIGWAWPGTNSAPIHLALAGLAVGLLATKGRSGASRAALGLAACGLSGFLLFGAVFAWQGAARFHIPLLVSLAPVVGAGLGRSPGRVGLAAAAVSLLIAGGPAILAIPTRPLLARPPVTQSTSVLRSDRLELLFRGDRRLLQTYQEIAAEVASAGCDQVGLMFDSGDLEYPWWVVLKAGVDPIRIEHLNLLPALESYADRSFAPCAVICTVCSQPAAELRGLPFYSERQGIIVYLRP